MAVHHEKQLKKKAKAKKKSVNKAFKRKKRK